MHTRRWHVPVCPNLDERSRIDEMGLGVSCRVLQRFFTQVMLVLQTPSRLQILRFLKNDAPSYILFTILKERSSRALHIKMTTPSSDSNQIKEVVLKLRLPGAGGKRRIDVARFTHPKELILFGVK